MKTNKTLDRSTEHHFFTFLQFIVFYRLKKSTVVDFNFFILYISPDNYSYSSYSTFGILRPFYNQGEWLFHY